MEPVHLLAGDDELLLYRETERVVAALQGADPELAVETHDVAETDHLPELRTTSLFGGRTCVVLRGVEALAGDLKREVEGYLAAPSPDAVLVLVARGTGKIPKVVKLAKEHGTRIDVKKPTDWDDRGWDRLVGEEFRRAGRQADASAIAAIREHAGNEPGVIASKVAQVCAAEADAPSLTAEHVERNVEGHGKVSGFAIADAVTDRDPASALVALRGALESGEAPLALLGAVTFRFRQLLQVRGGVDAKTAGISPGMYKRLQGLVGRFGPGELAWCHDRLARLDLELKGSELPDAIVLELGVIELATSREVGRPWNPRASS